MTMREGWLCPRCKASVSPDERTCPACSAAAPNTITVLADPTNWPANRCSKCGIKLEPVMGYCCPMPDCPTGLGSPFSRTTGSLTIINTGTSGGR